MSNEANGQDASKAERLEANRKRLSNAKREPARLFLIFFFILLTLTSWLFGPLLVGLAGVWLVIGSGNFWVRLATTVLLTLIWGLWGTSYFAFLLMVLFLTSSLTYLAAMALARLCQVPVRLLQFSLLEIGACTMILAAGMALLRAQGLDGSFFADQSAAALFVAKGVLVAFNLLLVCLPMIVPGPWRPARWSYLPLIAVIGLMPLVEVALFWLFEVRFREIDMNLHAGRSAGFETYAMLVLIHTTSGLVVWLLANGMEWAGAFHEVDLEKLTTPEKGPLD